MAHGEKSWRGNHYCLQSNQKIISKLGTHNELPIGEEVRDGKATKQLPTVCRTVRVMQFKL